VALFEEIERRFAMLTRARHDPVATFALIQRLHIVLLSVSAVVVGAAVLGAHGWL
jgi:hypothetical protein